MSTNNFAFENRCIVVQDDDFTFENVPKHLEYVQGCNRNYPSYYLDEYQHVYRQILRLTVKSNPGARDLKPMATFLTTEEMLKEFSYLDEFKIIKTLGSGYNAV